MTRTQQRNACYRAVQRYYQNCKTIVRWHALPFVAWWRMPGDRKEIIFTGVIAGATLVYAVYAGLLWRTTADSTDAAKHSADAVQTQVAVMVDQVGIQRETLRARIEFGEIPPMPIWPSDLGPIRDGPAVIPWQIQYRNVGGSAATEIWGFVTMGWVTVREPEHKCTSFIIPGMADTYVRKETRLRPLIVGETAILYNQIDVDRRLMEHWLTVDVQAIIYYRDEFDIAHETAMYIAYEPFAGSGYAYQICHEGTWAK